MNREIVAARIGRSVVTNETVISNNIDQVNALIDRQMARWMADLGMGEHWSRIAAGPALFGGENIPWTKYA